MDLESRFLQNQTLFVLDSEYPQCRYYKHLEKTELNIRFFTEPSVVETESAQPALLLIDASFAHLDIAAWIARYHVQHPQTQIIVMVTAQQSLLASDALRHGAIDYLQKPFTIAQLLRVIADAQQLLKPQQNLIAASAISQKVLQLARRVAHTDASVLITGESGTGKECLAQFIHDNSPRARGPFIAVNCAAIPENMLEAMLFGVNRGAYTGAVKSQAGKFELANGGTLLLDEIAELPLPLQAKLLRVLQERVVERLGSNASIQLDIRIIASTNQNLKERVSQGLFRQDLYYRLDVLPLSWPSLHERPEDIEPLARHFIQKYAPDSQFELSAAAISRLRQYPWPGNVRELENVIQRALILAKGLYLQPADLLLADEDYAQLPDAFTADIQVAPAEPTYTTLAGSKRLAEFQYVLDMLRRFNGHRTHTAQALGMTTRALRYKLAAMRENGIDIDCLVNS
jgi:two-component system response regulator FlrC